MKVDSGEIKSIAVLFGNKVPETTGQLESIAGVFEEIIIDPEMKGKALDTAKEYYEQVYIPVIQNLSCVIEDANQEMIRYQLDFSEQVTSSIGEQIDTDQLEIAENRIEQEIQRYIEAMDELKNAPLMDTQPLAISITAADYRKNKLKVKREKVESFESAHSNHFSNVITEIQHIQTMINSFKNGIPFNSDGSAYVLTSGQKASMGYLSKCTEKRIEKARESAPPDIGDRVWMEINESGYREWVLVEKGTSYATQADLIITKKYKEWALKYGKVEAMKEYSTAELDYHLAIINTGINPNTGLPVSDVEKWQSWGFALSTVSTVAISVYGTYRLYKGAVTSSEKADGLGKNIENVNPSEIRFSQTSVNGSDDIIASMKANGWKGDPIDVVRMPDGSLTTLDNTRVAAAREVGINVQATVRNYDDLLPPDMVARFTTPKGVPKTWGEATDLRIGKQKASFRNNNPMGSFDLEKMK